VEDGAAGGHTGSETRAARRAILAVCALMVSVLGLAGVVGWTMFVALSTGFREETVIADLPSSDGQYVAALLRVNPGAVDSYHYDVTLRRAGRAASSRDRIVVFVVEEPSPPGVEWTGPRELTVTLHGSHGILKQLTAAGEVVVRYVQEHGVPPGY